jgi:hypothetical protein
VLRLVPDTAGLYRAWAAPAANTATTIVMSKVVGGGASVAARLRVAPAVTLTDGTTGGSADLETRIDAAVPAAGPAAHQLEPLAQLIGAEPLTALLHVESTRPAADGIFVDRGSVVVLARASDWPAGQAAHALSETVGPVWTKGRLGMTWREEQRVGERFSALEGLESLQVAERGRLLFVANDPAMLASMLALVAKRPPDLEATYVGGFRHRVERARFASLTRLVDYTTGMGQDREPRFFSENLVSLSETLARVESASIVERDAGARVHQTVVYRRTP